MRPQATIVLAFKLHYGGDESTQAENIRHATDCRKDDEAPLGAERGAP